LRQQRRKIYRGSERESRGTNIDGFHCWPHERCFDRQREPIEPAAMLGDSAAAVSAMTAAWGCLFAALAGFRKKSNADADDPVQQPNHGMRPGFRPT
jgi:hypothetical protein